VDACSDDVSEAQSPAEPRRGRVACAWLGIPAMVAQYAGGFLGARSWTKGAFRGLRRGRPGSAPSLPPTGGRMTTLARASLVLQTARSHPPRFAPGLFTHGGFATGDPGVSPDRTRTGRPPRTCRSLCHAELLLFMAPSSLGALVLSYSELRPVRETLARRAEAITRALPSHVLSG
jgi:hypothetical protein